MEGLVVMEIGRGGVRRPEQLNVTEWRKERSRDRETDRWSGCRERWIVNDRKKKSDRHTLKHANFKANGY